MQLTDSEKELLQYESSRIDREDYNRHQELEIHLGKKMKYEPRPIVALLQRIAKEAI